MNNNYFPRQLPPALKHLEELAYDLRWNNSASSRHLWSRFHPDIWAKTENPLLVLQSAHQEQIDAAAADESLLQDLKQWKREVDDYYESTLEYQSLDPDSTLKRVAYFSMEYGLSESLPIYSGGLGMLAGDHLKTASDLGVPLVAIGLLYQQGYFRQVIDDDGQQLEAFPFNDPGSLPIRPVADKDGHWLRVRLPLPGRTLFLRVWIAQVGRVSLYLLDANDAMNRPWDRGITSQLYDASRERRLLQELVLGVGGWALVERLGIEVDVCHLNEGHAAFAVLARAASYARKHGTPLPVAFTATRSGNVFTTHTPVEAAFDRFETAMLARYAQPFIEESGVSLDAVLQLGRRDRNDQSESHFNMAWLAMRGCGHVNAVSRLHGEVSQGLFGDLFPWWPQSEIPVRPITNGVHVPTWSSHRAAMLWGDKVGGHLWLDGLDHVADRIQQMPVAELWEFRTAQRKALLDYTEIRCRHSGHYESTPEHRSLDPNALTIGFARRFATYKRANLLLTDPERFKRLLTDQQRPVQLIVAGKAHPNDGHGKALVQQMTKFLLQHDIAGKAIFLEDYDMVLGQHMVAGVDVWLNTPLRPNEACGTSGMKVLANGGLNVSILDGWWDEAVDPDDPGILPGWIVGSTSTGSMDDQRDADASSLYDVLEHQVIPEFYDHDADGIPHRWVERVKKSMTELTPRFSSTRMMHQYVSEAYLPAARAFAKRSGDGCALAKELRTWRDHLKANWHHVRVGDLRHRISKDNNSLEVECWLDEIDVDAVRVQLYADQSDEHASIPFDLNRDHELPGSVNGYLFVGPLPQDRPIHEFAVRVIPNHQDSIAPIECSLILWNK